MANPILGTSLMSVPVTALYGALNVLLTVGLSLNVMRLRTRHKVVRGDGGHDDLQWAIRAHGNNVENVPLALFLLLIAELCGGSSLTLHIFGGALLVARLAHAYGIIRRNPLQPVGVVLTLLVLIGLSVYTLVLRPWD